MKTATNEAIECFHNSRLIRQIQQNNLQKFWDLSRDWTQIVCLAVSHFNHYIRVFCVLLWGWNWILFVHGLFCLFLSNSSNWTKNSLFSCFSDLSDYLNSLNLVNFLSIRENSNDCSVNEDLLLQLALGFNCHHCLGSYFLPLLKKAKKPALLF